MKTPDHVVKTIKELYHDDGVTKKYIEWNDGLVVYYNKNGEIHKEDGPAVTKGNIAEFYLNGIYYPDINFTEELIIKLIID